MNKLIRIFLILLLISFGIVVSCFRIDNKEQKTISNDSESQKTEKTVEFKKSKSITIDGVDYLLSRGEVGKFGGSIVSSSIGEGPKTFNAWESKDATSSQFGDLMFDSLITTDVYTGEVIPKLAKDIKISKDKKTYILDLRHGIKWSDGKPITADDVIFTWNKIILGGYGNVSTRDSILIDGIPPKFEKVDDYTVKITTPKPFAPFLRLLSVPIAPKHVLEPVLKKGNKAFQAFWTTSASPKSFVTSGPFMLEEYVPAQRVVMKRNPNYYVIDEKHNKLPYLDKYIVLIVGDLNNELLKFEAKELDILSIRGKDVSRFKELEKKSDFTIYNLGPDTGTMFITFNLNKRKNPQGKYYVSPIKQAWFNDRNFRKAVDYAVDRENIVFNIANGVGQPLFTAEALPSIFLNKKLEKGHKRDINYARKLLEESGFKYDKKGILHDKKGNIVEFDLLTNAGNTEREAMGVMLKEDLNELGIKVNFKPIEFNSLVNKVTNTLDWDAIILAFTGNALEPHTGKNVWYSYGPLHIFNKREPGKPANDITPWEKQIDNIFDKASLELDFNKRKALYDQYQQIVYDEAPIIYLYSPLRITALRNKFGNIFPTPIGGVVHNPDEIYIKDTKSLSK